MFSGPDAVRVEWLFAAVYAVVAVVVVLLAAPATQPLAHENPAQ
jgi:hypothetical protein